MAESDWNVDSPSLHSILNGIYDWFRGLCRDEVMVKMDYNRLFIFCVSAMVSLFVLFSIFFVLENIDEWTGTRESDIATGHSSVHPDWIYVGFDGKDKWMNYKDGRISYDGGMTWEKK